MMISSKGRYALRVMTDLAQHREEGVVSLKAIAGRQNISLKYLENIVGTLAKAGVVLSRRGKDGGYRLARSPEEYTVAEILKLAEDGLAPVSCLESDENSCERADACQLLPVWQQLDGLIEAYLSGVTVADLVTGRIPPARLAPTAAQQPPTAQSSGTEQKQYKQ